LHPLQAKTEVPNSTVATTTSTAVPESVAPASVSAAPPAPSVETNTDKNVVLLTKKPNVNNEKERLEKERLEKEHLKKERLEKGRLEKERLEKERLEKERLEKARATLRKATSQERSLIIEAVSNSLFDSESARYKDINLIPNSYACVEVNAKNRFGGYTGFQTMVVAYLNNSWSTIDSLKDASSAFCLDLIIKMHGKN
jgi:hypothetical protein